MMTVARKIAISALGLSLLAGCASTPAVDTTKSISVTNPHSTSLANMMVSLAGYPGLLADNGYSKTLDAAVNAGAMSRLLPGDIGVSSMSAAGLGFALTALKGTYPVQNGAALFVLQPIKDASDITKPDFVRSTVLANLVVRTPGKTERADMTAILNNAKIDTLKCSAYTSFMNDAGFTHQCQIDGVRKDENVKVVGVYEGHDFDGVMPSVPKGKFAVVFVHTPGMLDAKPGAENVFAYKNGTLVNSIAVLPFVKANDEGKHLVYLNGKATLL